MNDASAEIKKTWHFVAVADDSVLEIRAICPRGVPDLRPPVVVVHFRCAEFSTKHACRKAFEEEALKLNAAGYNVYTVMNPIRPDFTGPGAARDTDIRHRDLLLIDIDRKGDTSRPASATELEAARALAEQVRDRLAARGWPMQAMVMSGNGYHLYYVLDGIENTPEAEALVRNTLTSLAAEFDNDIVCIDTSVYNASRITKVPGTVMRKGVATEDRPYRMAVVCDGD